MTQQQNTELTLGQGCFAILGYFLVWYGVLTPAIMVAWNIGLENAGIVSNNIGWWTALGLAVVVSLLRLILAAGRRRA